MLELLSCDWRISFASIPYSYSWSFVTQLKFGPGDIERLEVLPGSKVERTSERTLRIPDKGQAAFVALTGTWVGVSDQVEQRLPDGTVLPPVTMVIIKEPGSESDPQRIELPVERVWQYLLADFPLWSQIFAENIKGSANLGDPFTLKCIAIFVVRKRSEKGNN